MLAALPFELVDSIIRGPTDSTHEKPFNHFFITTLLDHDKDFNTGLIEYYNLFNIQLNIKDELNISAKYGPLPEYKNSNPCNMYNLLPEIKYLNISAKYGLLPEIKYLINSGANIHFQKNRSLIFAAENGHLAIVKYLVEGKYISADGLVRPFNGANIYDQDYAALKRAAENGHLAVLKFLVEYRSTFHINYFNNQILNNVAGNGHLAIIKYLFEKDINNNYNNIDNALIEAAKNGHLEVVKFLFEGKLILHDGSIRTFKRIKFYLTDDNALKWAIYNGHLEVVKYLVENVANFVVDRRYILRLAVERDHLEIYKYLKSLE